MKISIVHDWDINYEQELTWKDGLAAAIRELIARGHDVKFMVCGKEDTVLPHDYFPIHVTTDVQRSVKEHQPDVILMWADCTRPNAKPCAELGIPMALCFAGGEPHGPTSMYFDHFFVESQVYKEKFEALGCSVSTAFGTNTELFKPIPQQEKVFDVIFPATFARWKRHDLFAESTRGLRSAAIGYMIPGWEEICYQWCESAGSLVLPHVSAEALRHFYAASKVVLITSIYYGGSQRTVLEAMAMNIPLIVMEDSDKCSEYVREAGQGLVVRPEAKVIRGVLDDTFKNVPVVNTRDYIMSKWSEYIYADNLEKGLKALIK